MTPRRRTSVDAVACTCGAAAVLALVAVGVPDGLDAWVAQQAGGHVRPALEEAADQLTHLSDGRYGVAVGVLVILACGVLGGLRALLVAALLVVGANVTGLLLDPHFVRDLSRDGTIVTRLPASAPSNHAVLSSSLAASVALAASRRWRPLLIGVGVAWALLIAACVLALRTHVVSDVVSGWLLTGAWTAVAVQARRRSPTRPMWWTDPSTGVRVAAAIALVAVTAVGAAVSGAGQDAADALTRPGRYVPALLLLAVVCGTTAAVVAAADRRRGRSSPLPSDADRRARPSDGQPL